MQRRTKIIATLGPATSTLPMIEKLVRAGADVVRLNFSHGTVAEHTAVIRNVRKVSKKMGRPIGILADLPGPKLRTGLLRDGTPVFLKPKSTITLTTRSVQGTSEVIPVTYQPLPKHVRKGDPILLADGLLELRVLRTSSTDITCRVVTGGELGEHKGINLPGLRLPIPALTEKDLSLLRPIVRAGVDFIALSFVQQASDIENARRALEKVGGHQPIIAKIEKPDAVRNIRAILRVVDGIMVARGDLGVEVPTSRIPVIQKELIHLADELSVPVITATQMLDSMILNPRPTRAETTDVANAIWDGTDTVMLSGETAAGKYPIEAVRTMVQIIEDAEEHQIFQWKASTAQVSTNNTDTILHAATRVGQHKLHKAIVVYTASGYTAIALSKLRPNIPIIALTPSESTYQQLSLVWGARAFHSRRGHSVEDMIRMGDQILTQRAGLKKNDRIILVAGTRLASGGTNILKIHQIGETLMQGRR